MEALDNIAAEIIFHLKYLSFLNEAQLTGEDVDRYAQYLQQLLSSATTDVAIASVPDRIEEVTDSTIKLALLREARFVTRDGNNLIYNGRKFPFNHAYDNENYELLIQHIVDFLALRIQACKDTILTLFGYSGCGKSTLCNRLVQTFNWHQRRFKLYEIYTGNRVFVMFQGTRMLLNDPSTIADDKYSFMTSDIVTTMQRFARKAPTLCNSSSSRSHTILEVLLPDSRVIIADLAGNEKCQDTDPNESKYINSSLYNLCRYVKLGDRFKEKGDRLVNLVKSVKNHIFLSIYHDNQQCLAANHLMLLQ